MIIRAYELAQTLVLEPASRYLGLPLTGQRHSILVLDDQAVTQLLRTETKGKSIFIFSFGYAVFVGFSYDEISLLLRSIRLLLGLPAESPVGAAMDTLDLSTIVDFKDFTEPVLRKVAPVLLARSMALHRQVALVDKLLDESEPIITRLHKNQRWFNQTIVRKVASRLLRFEVDLIRSAGLLDTHAGFSTGQDIKAYAVIEEMLDLKNRIFVHRVKLGRIKSLLDFYTRNRLSTTLFRSYGIEIVLLSIFPLPYFFPVKVMFFQFIRWISSWLP